MERFGEGGRVSRGMRMTAAEAEHLKLNSIGGWANGPVTEVDERTVNWTPPQVQTGIPIPPPRRKKAVLDLPFDDMKIGDSFFVPGNKHIDLVRSAVSLRQRESEGKEKYTTRLQAPAEPGGGMRVWRIE